MRETAPATGAARAPARRRSRAAAPSSRRISPSACSPVRSIASKRAASLRGRRSSILRPPRACTTTTAMACEIDVVQLARDPLALLDDRRLGLRLLPLEPVLARARRTRIITPASQGPPVMKAAEDDVAPHEAIAIVARRRARRRRRRRQRRSRPGLPPGVRAERSRGRERTTTTNTVALVGKLDEIAAIVTRPAHDDDENGERPAAAHREREHGEGRGRSQRRAVAGGVRREQHLGLERQQEPDGERGIGVPANDAPDAHGATVRHGRSPCRRSAG